MFKATLYALLAANTAYFAVAESASKAVDAGAWLILLGLFEAETRLADRPTSLRRRFALRAARLAAGAGVVAATIGYVFEDNVLDAANSVLWIAVVVLLEIEVRYPVIVRRARGALSVAGLALYGGLAVLVLMWAVRGQWFDAYDALLWLMAFATIELRLLTAPGGARAPVMSR